MFSSSRFVRSLIVKLFIFSLGFSCLAFGQTEKKPEEEKGMSVKDLPKTVISAFQEQYPNAKIKSVSKEVGDSTEYYEIESLDGKTRRTVLYSTSGQLTEIEEVIPVEKLPDPARKEIAKSYPEGKIEAAEKITKGGVTSYEVKVEKGKEYFEAAFDSNGRLLSAKNIKADEEKD